MSNVLMNREEAAQSLRVSIRTVDHYTKLGLLGHVRIGVGKGRVLYRQQDLNEFVQSNVRPAKEAQ